MTRHQVYFACFSALYALSCFFSDAATTWALFGCIVLCGEADIQASGYRTYKEALNTFIDEAKRLITYAYDLGRRGRDLPDTLPRGDDKELELQ